MREVGKLDMEIYIPENQLFMIMDIPHEFDYDAAMAVLAKKARKTERETYLSKFQKTYPDASAGEKWKLMERIYKLGE